MEHDYYSELVQAEAEYRRTQSDESLVAILRLAKAMAHELNGDVQCIACDEWVAVEDAELDAEGWLCDNCAYAEREDNDNG